MGKIADLFVKLGLKNDEFNKKLDESKKKTSAFASGLKKIGGLIAGAFAVSQVVDFGKELIVLAGEAEGVEKAFRRIGDDKSLQELRMATRNTVSDLELMKKAVQANNFQIPLENLASLFEFATARAAQTGESVDFLVNSIVLGIGRKSPLILDNLGISAVRLRETLKGAGTEVSTVSDIAAAVGKIAASEMKKMGDTAQTSGQQIQSFAATWDNLKLNIGRAVVATKEYFTAIQVLSGINNLFTDIDDSQNKLAIGAKRIFDSWNKGGKLTIDTINERIKALKEENHQLVTGGDFANKNTRDRREGNWKLIRLLKERLSQMSKVNSAEKEQSNTINSVKAEIEALQKIQGDASGKNLENINKEIESLNNYLNLLKKVGTTEKEKPILKTPSDLPTLETSPLVGAGINKTSQAGALSGLDEVFEKTQKKQEEFIASQRAFNEQAAGLATDFISDTVVTFAEGIGQMFAGDFNIEDFGKALLQAVGNFLSMLGKMMIQFGVTALIYATLAKALANPATAGPAAVAMIAAGAALVAIGSAIGSAASGGSSAGGTGAITTIDTRGASTPSTSNSLRQTEVQPVTVQVEGNISNKTIALSNNLGQKDIRR